MALPPWFDDDIYQKAIQIAATAHGPDAAKDVVYDALSHLDASTLTAQKTLLDRVKMAREKTTLVLLGPPLLQRLIYKYSDLHAAREAAGECRNAEDRMLGRYLQVLLLYCLHRSSRWMAIGLAQFVFSYSGTEVAEMTGQIARKDWDHSDRTRAKGKLLEHLGFRFSGLVPASESVQGDRHFEPAPNQNSLVSHLEHCLRLFTPWGTPHAIRSAGDLRKGLPAELMERNGSPLDADLTELNRCHVFIDLTCFQLLLDALGYAVWRSRMRLPALCQSERDKQTRRDGQPEQPESNSATEVRHKLKRDASRRASADKNSLRVYVDDRFVGMIEGTNRKIVFRLPADADVISVCTNDSAGEILLASHILRHSEEGVPLPSSGLARVGHGHNFAFDVSLDLTDPEAAICAVRHSVLWLAAFSPLPGLTARRAMVAAALLFAAAGVWVYEASHSPAVFAVIVGPQTSSARSVLRDGGPADELISVPRGTKRIQFKVHPRDSRAGKYLVEVKVDRTSVYATSIEITASDSFSFEVPAANLKTGTYSVEVSPERPGGAAGAVETHKFQMVISR